MVRAPIDGSPMSTRNCPRGPGARCKGNVTSPCIGSGPAKSATFSVMVAIVSLGIAEIETLGVSPRRGVSPDRVVGPQIGVMNQVDPSLGGLTNRT